MRAMSRRIAIPSPTSRTRWLFEVARTRQTKKAPTLMVCAAARASAMGTASPNANTRTQPLSVDQEGGHLKGMINIPFADGKTALRLVAYATEYAGFIDALREGGGKKSDVNGGSVQGFRAAVKFQSNDTNAKSIPGTTTSSMLSQNSSPRSRPNTATRSQMR